MSEVENLELADSSAYLIWEDADDRSWWLARSHDENAVYVIALDAITGHVLSLRQSSTETDFKVIAAVSQSGQEDLSGGISEGKRNAVKWLGDPSEPTLRAGVRRWRATRWSKIAIREVPLTITALLIGAVLAFIVAAFFVATNIAGWPMIAVGTLFGTLAGWLLKWLVDRKMKSFLGPLGRFFTVAGSAALGALLTTSVFFVLFGV